LGDSVLSSEIKLANSHSDFWSGLLPMGEAFIRAQNSKPQRFASPVVAFTPPDQRAVVNEAGFLFFKELLTLSSKSAAGDDALDKSFRAAFAKNDRLPKTRRPSLDETLTLGRYEARAIALNLRNHFKAETETIQVNPPIPGCGWVSDVEADILCGTTLYEVKAGDRHFRLSDLRQLLTYCALNFSSKTYEIRDIALINPRSGTLIKESLDKLCRQTSGAASVQILGEIVSFISEPNSTYFTY
jgi:hypothetical protein